jgi:lysophospholipase L1-like esterase
LNRRRWLKLALATTVAGEAGLRALDALLGRPTGSLYSLVTLRGDRHVLAPPGRLIVPERYGDVEYAINRLGYRDREHDLTGNRDRILILGDSVAFGLGARQEARFGELLESSLRSRGLEVDVINLAMFAYNTGNELQALREDGLQFLPRLVIVSFFMNDFAMPEPGTAPAAPGLMARLSALQNRLLYSSNLWRRLSQLASGTVYRVTHDARRRLFPDSLNAAEPVSKLALLEAHPDDEQIAAFRALRAIAEQASSGGASTLLLLTPDEVQLHDTRYDGIDRRIAAFCRGAGIGFVDALPALRAAPGRERLFLDGVHLSAQGHQVVAGALRAEVESRLGRVPRP